MPSRSTKQRITDSALKLFEEFGFHAVTVDTIVKDSSTSKGGFYHNFRSKDELLYTIHDSFITYVIDKAVEAHDVNETPAEKLYETVRSFVKMFEVYRPHVTVFYQESVYLSPEFYENIKKKRKKYKDLMFKVVQEGKEAGEFREELPVPITSMAIFGMINWTYKWYKAEGEYSIQEIADIYADLIMHSVLTEEARKNPDYQCFFYRSSN